MGDRAAVHQLAKENTLHPTVNNREVARIRQAIIVDAAGRPFKVAGIQQATASCHVSAVKPDCSYPKVR